MIKRITDAYVRHYSDNDQVLTYVAWEDDAGTTGTTEGRILDCGHDDCYRTDHMLGSHMAALFARASREGVQTRGETW